MNIVQSVSRPEPAAHRPADEQAFRIDASTLHSMLGHVPCVRHACDLDLLLYFHRHGCALLSESHVFARLGYGLQQSAASLDGLVDAGVVTRSRNRSGTACLYTLQIGGLADDPLRSLLRIAATPDGRRYVKRQLAFVPASAATVGLAFRATPDRSAAA